MYIFLTSLPYGAYRSYSTDYKGMNPENGFEAAIKKVWKPGSKVLFIASEPDNYEMVDLLSGELKKRLIGSGLDFCMLESCDHRSFKTTADDINKYDAIFLSGGHVPTTNDFYKEIGLRDKMRSFDGIVVGISSGSMNSAYTVYAQPEFDGESAAEFVRFRHGLGLVNFSIIPHYQTIKTDIVDGKRLFEDISYADSMGRRFYVFVDGTYASKVVDKKGEKLVQIGDTVIHGEAYLLENGVITKICDNGGEYAVKE